MLKKCLIILLLSACSAQQPEPSVCDDARQAYNVAVMARRAAGLLAPEDRQQALDAADHALLVAERALAACEALRSP